MITACIIITIMALLRRKSGWGARMCSAVAVAWSRRSREGTGLIGPRKR